MGNDPSGSRPPTRASIRSPAGDAVVVVDSQWRVSSVAASPSFARFVEPLLGRVLTEAHPELVGTEWHARLSGVMAGGGPAGFEGFYGPAGAWVEVRAWPAVGGGMTVFCQDVTGSRAGVEPGDVARDWFLETLGHELRMPLAPVLAAAGLLEGDGRLPEAAREEAGVIRRNVEAEARLLDDLLELHRIGRGEVRLDAKLADVHGIIGDALDGARAEILAKKIWLRMDLHATRQTVRADAGRLGRVFGNLLRNAVKFTPAGGTVIVRSADQGAGTIRVEVQDTGVGIEPGELSRVFEAFEQGSGSAGGLRLGLAICRGLVELHGGRIWAESTGVGRGATFAVELPTVAEGVSAGPAVVPRRLRVLVVEDHVSTARMLAKVIGGMGHDVATAGSIAEAGQAAASRHFDLLVSDVGLGDGSGLDLMGILRKHDPAVRGITLSGYGTEEDRQKSAAAGFAAHLTKPVGLEQLKEAIARVAGKEA